LAGGGALLVGGAVLLACRERSRQVLELVLQAGGRALRSPLRSLTPGPRVLLIGLDGVGQEALAQAIARGNVPVLAGLLGADRGEGRFAHGYAVPDALSILPSTTVAAWTSIFTGAPPGHTGVTGNEWFSRAEGRFFAPAPVSLDGRLDTLRYLNEGLVGDAARVETLFEKADVRSHVSLAHVYRGADVFTMPDPTELAEVAGLFACGLTKERGEFERTLYSKMDEESVDTLLEAMTEHGVPRLQVVYFPGVDLYTHVACNALEEQQVYLREVIDPQIGRVLSRYRETGLLDETFVVVVADHGHTPVIHDEQHALGAEGDDEATELLRGLGFRVRAPRLELPDGERGFDAAVAYQGAIAYVYLADRSTRREPDGPCDWCRPPRLEEEVLTVARAFHRANVTGEGRPGLKGTIDLIFARDGCAVGCDAPPFKIFDGERLVPIREHLARHPRPDLLDLADRIDALGVGPRGHNAGDLLLLARSGLERPIEDRYYFAKLYRSWHGSPSAQDSRIPIIVARAGGDGAKLESLVRACVGDPPSQLDVAPLVLRLLRETT
jgi:hypothetical protein